MGLEVAALAVTAIGVGISAYSQYQQGQAQAQSASYQSQVAVNNAALSQINATNARRDAAFASTQAATEEQNVIRRGRALIGSQVASTAGRGLLVNEGSAVDLRESTARLTGEEAGNIRTRGDRRNSEFQIRAFNYEQQAGQQATQASLYSDQAGAASQSAWLGATGALVGGASRVYSQYSDMARTGVSFSGNTVVA
jgi:hypothetical protein